MIMKKILFQVSIMAMILFFATIGMYGGDALATSIFGDAESIFSLSFLMFVFFVVFGCAVSGLGAIFTIVIPLSIRYPELCKPSYFGKDEIPHLKVLTFWRWYLNGLQEQMNEYDKSS